MYKSNTEKLIKLSFQYNTADPKVEPLLLGFLTPLITFNNIKDTGSYILIINSDIEGGATGIYAINRSDKLQFGNIKEIAVSKGVNGEILNVDWEPCEYPKILLHIHKFKTDKKMVSFNFNVKIL